MDVRGVRASGCVVRMKMRKEQVVVTDLEICIGVCCAHEEEEGAGGGH
jgi:hypothetical protein